MSVSLDGRNCVMPSSKKIELNVLIHYVDIIFLCFIGRHTLGTTNILCACVPFQ